MDRIFLLLGGVLGGLGVALGAFGAHSLRRRIAREAVETFEIAVRYQIYHSLATIIVALTMNAWPDSRTAEVAGWAFLAGILIFCGSLYLLVITGRRWLGAIAPLGGLAFLAGWVFLTLAVV